MRHRTPFDGAWRSALPLIAFAAAACFGGTEPPEFILENATLTARPTTPTVAPTLGFTDLGITTGRDGLLYVPASYDPATPAPLLILLHGSSGSADEWSAGRISEIADEFGIVILMPDSRGRTWDRLGDGVFGPDVAFINQALVHVFQRCNIDPAAVGMAGFSDGGSYALSLGIINGDFFKRLIAFAPGVVRAPVSRGAPIIYIAHGIFDGVFPVAISRDRIVPNLRTAGYQVFYVEFEGGHTIPFDVARSAFEWFAVPTTP
jgi:phospholipase/carboxylesterase